MDLFPKRKIDDITYDCVAICSEKVFAENIATELESVGYLTKVVPDNETLGWLVFARITLAGIHERDGA